MQSSFTRLYNRTPDYCFLRTFGSACFPWQRPQAPDKLSPRSSHCIFIGYSLSHKGYQCFDPVTDKIIISHHVTFDESSFPSSINHISTTNNPIVLTLLPNPHFQIPPTTPPSFPVTPPTPTHLPLPTASPPIQTPPTDNSYQSPLPEPPTLSSISPTTESAPHTSSTPPNHHPMITRSKAGITKPKTILNLNHSLFPSTDPTSYSQATRHPHWRQAMSAEFLALQ